MPVVAHPGPTSPAPPTVRLEVPDAWATLPAGEALLHVEGPGSAEQPVTVVVRHVVGAAGVDGITLVEESATRAGGDGGQVEDPFVVDIGGREWAARNVSWAEVGTPVVEVHLATGLPTEGDTVSRHVLAVGRVGGTGLEPDYDTLQGVLETLVVDGEPA